MFGEHMVKSWSSTQNLVSLSSGEAEYYGLVKAGSMALGIRGLLADLGHKVTLELKSDASAAIGIARRRGVGKVRHIEVNQLWIQDRVFRGDLKLTKVPGQSNLADGLTKYISSDQIKSHMFGSSQHVSEGRHENAPKVNMDDWEEGIKDDVCEDYEEEGSDEFDENVCNLSYFNHMLCISK